MSAAYSSEDALLELVFDRPVNIAGFNGAAVIVDDAVELQLQLNGQGGAALQDPVTVYVTLGDIGDPTGAGIVLNASAGSGIVAVDDGGMWGGVIGVGLPFP